MPVQSMLNVFQSVQIIPKAPKGAQSFMFHMFFLVSLVVAALVEAAPDLHTFSKKVTGRKKKCGYRSVAMAPYNPIIKNTAKNRAISRYFVTYYASVTHIMDISPLNTSSN